MTPYRAILPDPDIHLRDRGHRLSVETDGESMYVDICEERVWPEKVDDPNASAILEVTDRIMLHAEGVRWLRDRLTEVLEQWESEEVTS